MYPVRVPSTSIVNRGIEPLQLFVEQRALQGDECLEGFRRNSVQLHYGPRGSAPSRSGAHQRVVGQIAQMFEAAGADDQQADHQQDQLAPYTRRCGAANTWRIRR